MKTDLTTTEEVATKPMSDQKTIEQTAANFFAHFLGDTSLQEALADGRRFSYRPCEDITAYELSLCLYLISVKLSANCSLRDEQKVFDALPPEAQRHFAVVLTEQADD